ncbi:MAG: PEP-CTERM sorting domain-containing protein [Planctomycetes bacterium]|nr:PEP-CTERM sorting domain-containing protein [Planctomycetota bacterium]
MIATSEAFNGSSDPSADRSAVDAAAHAAEIPAASAPGMPAEPGARGHLVRTTWVPSAPAPLSEARSELGLGLAIPEPLSLVLAGIAILGLVFLARRRPA